jgi:hypothetical protein
VRHTAMPHTANSLSAEEASRTLFFVDNDGRLYGMVARTLHRKQ